GGVRGALLRRVIGEDSQGAQELQGNRAPAGGARRSARDKSHRRLRASPDGDPGNLARIAPPLSWGADLGGVRASLKYNAPFRLPAGTTGCAQSGRRRLHFSNRASRTNPGKRAARPAGGDEIDRS